MSLPVRGPSVPLAGLQPEVLDGKGALRSQGPSTMLAICDSVTKAFRALGNPHDPARDEEVAQSLRDCLRSGCLDLQALPERAIPALCHPGVWKSLQQHVIAGGADGIDSLNLPLAAWTSHQALIEDIVRGLGELASLRDLAISGPAGGILDLGHLPGHVVVAAYGVLPREVRVRDGALVLATSFPRVRHKSRVIYVDDKGRQICEPRTLPGVLYDRTATGLEQLAKEQGSDAQDLARQTRLVGAATFPDDKAVPLLAPSIMCRDITVQWIKDSVARVSGECKAGKGERRFTYENYRSKDQLARHVERSSTIELSRLVRKGARFVFEISRFGDMIADEFERMTAGTNRQFICLTPSHCFGVQLRFKTRLHGSRLNKEFVVRFYDSHFTQLHARGVFAHPALVRRHSMEAWMVPEPGMDLLASHFVDRDGPCIAALYEWPDGGAGVPKPRQDRFERHVPPECRESPQFLFWALAEDSPDHVQACMDQMITAARERPLRPSRLEHLLSGEQGLGYAMSCGRVAAVKVFLQTVLDTEASLLPSTSKHALLTSSYAGRSALECAFRWADAPSVATFTQQVLNAATVLQHSHLLDLLNPLQPDGPDKGEPLMHCICALRGGFGPDPEIPHERSQAIFVHMSSILSSAILSLAEKAGLCASFHGPAPSRTTAAQAALREGNMGAAAAMLCAALELPDTDHRAVLLRSLGVTPQQVLTALAGSNLRQEYWTSRIKNSIKESAPPPR